VAHILVPTGLVVGAWLLPGEVSVPALSVLFTAALAFGAADTFASEFGVLAGAARSILTARPVAPGTNGGVSALGELWALAGALTTAIVSVGLLVGFRVPYGSPGILLAVASSAGFLGCQLDSVLGELLENRGLLTKGSTNLLAMFGAVVIAGGLLAGFGGWG
ncbi:MAG TPA: DUF92 domain-containing protein, partial [Thermoplasmata archaeon]|nr:DUF92 domain-containing protein [Thermoplasmata archaeon]